MTRFYVTFLTVLTILASCTRAIEPSSGIGGEPPVYPDCVGVTVPVNIAPLNFKLADSLDHKKVAAVFKAGDESLNVISRNGVIRIPVKKWRRLTQAACGGSMEVMVCFDDGGGWVGYSPFQSIVSGDKADPWLAYRLIEPGYETWNKMGIYQRCIEDFKEKAVIKNTMTGGGCMNCHSFRSRNPGSMMFHMRAINAGTMLFSDGQLEKLNTKTDKTISALVYPYWHPSGRYIAFSVNDTKQAFHTSDANRIEVFDLKSDVVVYDVEKHEVIVSPILSKGSSFETFPTFSPDGKTLFYCSADSVGMPYRFDEVRYKLCSVPFDEATGTVGSEADTLYQGKSVSFPRVSPDGRFLMLTLSDYGNFSIWHQEADLFLIDLKDGSLRRLDAANSGRTESYHSWSGNNRWAVFSSRRGDGLYTRPYFVHIDGEGNPSKPFPLPQKDPDFYGKFMKSYNIPEFVEGQVRLPARKIARMARKDKGIDVK